MATPFRPVQIADMPRKIRKAAPDAPTLTPGRDLHLRAWRDFRGLNQEQLAARIDKTAPTISQLERHRINYTQEHVEALAVALNTAPADLFFPPPAKEKSLSEFELWARRATDEEKAMALRLIHAARDIQAA